MAALFDVLVRGLRDLGVFAPAADVNAALALKAPLSSPAFTDIPTAPTATLGTNTKQVATMEALSAALTNIRPKAAAGVGQWTIVYSATLPSGGTWAWIGFNSDTSVNWNPGAGAGAIQAGVDAGGTVTTGWSAAGRVALVCWRIA